MSTLSERGLPEATERRPLPPLGSEHEVLRAELREFVGRELRPHAREWEQARWFPNEVFERMGELGLLGLKYPTELGGRGGSYLDDAVLTEELSRSGSGGVAAGVGAHISIATPPVWKFGTPDQKARFLAPAIRGEKIAEAKLLSQRAALEVADTAFRILHGDEEISRVLRDVRLGPIGGGTDEVMKEILSRQLGL